MRRNGFGAGSFLLGILVGIVLLILIAFAVSSNSTVQFNAPNGSISTEEPTTAPGQLPREKSSPPDTTVTFNARVAWNQFINELASIPQAIVNWVRSLGDGEDTHPTILITTATPTP